MNNTTTAYTITARPVCNGKKTEFRCLTADGAVLDKRVTTHAYKGCFIFRVNRLARIRQLEGELRHCENQAALYDAIGACATVEAAIAAGADVRKAGAGRDWDISCLRDSLKDGSYPKWATESRARAEKLRPMIEAAKSDPAEHAPFVEGWTSNPNRNPDTRGGYYDHLATVVI